MTFLTHGAQTAAYFAAMRSTVPRSATSTNLLPTGSECNGTEREGSSRITLNFRHATAEIERLNRHAVMLAVEDFCTGTYRF